MTCQQLSSSCGRFFFSVSLSSLILFLSPAWYLYHSMANRFDREHEMKITVTLSCQTSNYRIDSIFFRAISHFCFLLLARNVSHSNCIFAAVERNNWTNEKEISVRHQIFLWCWGRNKQCAWLLLLSSFSKQIIHVCVIQFASSVRWNTLCLHVLLHFVDTWIVLTISVTNEWSENNQRIHTDNARQCWSNGCIFDWFFGDCANN